MCCEIRPWRVPCVARTRSLTQRRTVPSYAGIDVVGVTIRSRMTYPLYHSPIYNLRLGAWSVRLVRLVRLVKYVRFGEILVKIEKVLESRETRK